MKLLACILALAVVFFGSAVSSAYAQATKSALKARSAVSGEVEDIKDF